MRRRDPLLLIFLKLCGYDHMSDTGATIAGE